MPIGSAVFGQPTLAAAHEWFSRIRQVAQMCIVIDASIAAAITKICITRDISLPIILLLKNLIV